MRNDDSERSFKTRHPLNFVIARRSALNCFRYSPLVIRGQPELSNSQTGNTIAQQSDHLTQFSIQSERSQRLGVQVSSLQQPKYPANLSIRVALKW